MAASNPAESVRVPILLTKSARPKRMARSLNLMVRKTAAAPFSTSDANSHPAIRITAKPVEGGNSLIVYAPFSQHVRVYEDGAPARHRDDAPMVEPMGETIRLTEDGAEKTFEIDLFKLYDLTPGKACSIKFFYDVRLLGTPSASPILDWSQGEIVLKSQD